MGADTLCLADVS